MSAARNPSETRAGLGYGVSAYLIWGILPLYFVLLTGIDPFEIVAWRVLLTLVFCALLLVVTRQWPATVRVLRDRRTVLGLALAGLTIYANWQTFIIASTSGHVVDASLGYFLNPVVTVLIAVTLLGERPSAMQWVAIAVTVVAFVVIAVGYGTFPWIAVVLALSFGFYGYIKRRVGSVVPALPGLFVETLLLSPVALVALGIIAVADGLSFTYASGGTLALLSVAGVATAVPLILFAASARRLSLTVIGFMQYIGPTLMLFVGWLWLGEDIPPARWLGFALVWGALVLLTVDSVRRVRSGPRTA